uniref:B12-binding domain-containing protein n=1 Tax=Desulfatirhabdium butyrativorans TaxID=340467 RepID=A0A7C4VRA6_9BACT
MMDAVSEPASRLFTTEFSQLSALVQKRLDVEWHYHQRSNLAGPVLQELIEYADDFGRMLKVVFRHSLLDALRQEAEWYARVLTARGRGGISFAALLESWIVVIQGVLKPPECNELSHPLQRLHRDLPQLLQRSEDALKSDIDRKISPLVEVLIRGDAEGALDVVSRLIGSGKSMDQVIVDGILPAMSEVGFLWERRRLDIFQEHLATETVRCLLAGVVWTFKTVVSSPQRTALVSCVPGDKHDLVPLALWACLMIRGWTVRNLGTGLPADQIARAAAAFSPDIVFLVLTLLSRLDDALETIAMLRKYTPDLPIVIGGRGAEAARVVLERTGASVAHDFEEAFRMLPGAS